MTENNTQQSPRKLFSLVALIFFAPIVWFLLNDSENDYELTENDLKIINTYKKAWYFVWALTLSIVAILIAYLKFEYSILIYIVYFITTILVVYMIYNIKLIFDGKWALLFSDKDIKKIEIQEVKAWNIDYLLVYIPFLNEYLFQTKKYTQEQEYWLKESIFVYFFLWMVGSFAIFYDSFIKIFYLIVLFIVLRIVSLFVWVDFIPDNIKAWIYNSFKNRVTNLFAYFCALIHFIFQNLFRLVKWKKTYEYKLYLHKANEILNQEVDIKSILKKPKKYLYIILSYTILVILLAYLLYKWYFSFLPYVHIISVLIIWNYFFMWVFIEKKLYNIPFLSAILWKILKKF